MPLPATNGRGGVVAAAGLAAAAGGGVIGVIASASGDSNDNGGGGGGGDDLIELAASAGSLTAAQLAARLRALSAVRACTGGPGEDEAGFGDSN